jgi:hypothetical protein
MLEADKYNLLWNLPQGYGNNYDHPYWKEIVATLQTHMQIQAGDSMIDIGGGDQRLAQFFPHIRYTSLDIATAAMAPGENAYPHIVADISEWHDFEKYDWAISIDVMEHLPTLLVPKAITNISQSVIVGAAFLISNRPDRGGRKIGEVLHLTVRPPDWWHYRLSVAFKEVQIVRVVKGEYCLVVCRNDG